MSILEKLSQRHIWEQFYSHKIEQGNISEKDAQDLRFFIDNEEYMPVAHNIEKGIPFSYPHKSLVNKSKQGKKRAVYTYNREENYVLKLIAYLLTDYDYLFAPNLYSFRKNRGVKKAVEDVLKIRDINGRYVYKVDISNYFNTVDITLLLPKLEVALSDDYELFLFLKSLLMNPYIEYEGEIIEEQKGIMAGVPISGFLADLYLKELDFYFYENKIPYMRYSDDILVFAKDENELEQSIGVIKECLLSHNLSVNSDKESVSEPFEKWNFLGFSYDKGVIDISDASFEKLKAKMRRKARSLYRWASKKKISGEFAARAFVKRFNTKLYDNPVYSELTWTRWFFPVINTSATLEKIDEYMLLCIRYLATGKHTKARYNFRYEDIKSLGYRSLVNEYYKAKSSNN